MSTVFQKLLLAAALGLGLVGAASAADASSDAALASSIKTALAQSGKFVEPSNDIVVTVNQGKVNLSGWVAYASDVQAAEQLAAKVGGVTAVSESLRTWSNDERP